MLQLSDFQIAARLPPHLAPFAVGNYNHRLKELTIEALKSCGGVLAYVTVRYGGKIYALTTSGFVDNHYSVDANICDQKFLEKLDAEDFTADKNDLDFVKGAFSHLARGINIAYFVNCVLPFDNLEPKLKINIIDCFAISSDRTNKLTTLQELARAAVQDITAAVFWAPAGRSTVQESAPAAVSEVDPQYLREDATAWTPAAGLAEGGEDGSVVADFLLRTLIEKPQLRTRKGIQYSALATWKKAIKDTQIRALFALKKNLPDDFVATLAERFAASVESSIGRSAFKYVVGVPCGNSGPGCLSQKLAEKIAARFGSEFAVGFENFPQLGTSHPKNNVRLGRPKAIRAFDGPVLLVDDVATSGSHVELSTKALRKVAPAVFPIVWICD